jgi:CheY-like chemotaxis protein
MFPYYHPTTVTLIDDDRDFLRSLSFSAIGDLLHTMFSRPDEALHFLHEQNKLLPRFDDFVTAYDRSINIDVQHGERLLRLQPGKITALTRNMLRFAINSVVVVDYDMPGINGLQFCRALGNLPVRKLLLTGKAGTDIGVKALNEGVIDGYFVKQDANLIKTLGAGIAGQKHAFFSEITRPLMATIGLDEMSFLHDEAFADVFTEIKKSNSAVEYYSCSEPPGLLTVGANGQTKLIVVCDDSALEAHAEIAREAGAPQEFIALLERRAIIPVFPANSYYHDQFAGSWRNFVWPAKAVVGTRQWYVGIATSGEVLAELSDGCQSLESYAA